MVAKHIEIQAFTKSKKILLCTIALKFLGTCGLIDIGDDRFGVDHFVQKML